MFSWTIHYVRKNNNTDSIRFDSISLALASFLLFICERYQSILCFLFPKRESASASARGGVMDMSFEGIGCERERK